MFNNRKKKRMFLAGTIFTFHKKLPRDQISALSIFLR